MRDADCPPPINSTVLISTIPLGGHRLIDPIGGGAIAACAILIACRSVFATIGW
jgi:membrane-associated phospholipid phosphatase